MKGDNRRIHLQDARPQGKGRKPLIKKSAHFILDPASFRPHGQQNPPVFAGQDLF